MIETVPQLMPFGAILSPDRKYRYLLWRTWTYDLPRLNVIGLNPSTADETVDDATVRRIVRFAERDGYGGIQLTNLYALRSKEPRDLITAKDPVGPENNKALSQAANFCKTVVAAWGASYVGPGKDERVRVASAAPLTGDLWCWGMTKEGHPRHPLYLSAKTPLIRWFKPAPAPVPVPDAFPQASRT